MSKLKLTNISQSYRETGRKLQALQNINLTVDTGQFVTIIGPSGCGKSTLLQIVAGLQRADIGTVEIDGEVTSKRLGKIAYMPQEHALLPWRTILDNVVIGAEIRGTGRRQTRQRALELLPLFGLDGFANAYPAQLSGGMKQRAAFLRTFLIGQDIVLLDEPFGALDAQTRRELHEWLLDIWQVFNYTILFVTHDVEEAIYLSDKVVVLSARPGTVIKEVDIPFKRPRKKTLERFSPEMIELEHELFNALRGNTE